MAHMGPTEPEKLQIGKKGCRYQRSAACKGKEEGENKAGEDAKAQDGESGKNNNEKE